MYETLEHWKQYKLDNEAKKLQKKISQEFKLNEFTTKKGKTITYNHDKVYEVMKSKLSTLPCWTKYKSYTATNNIPMSVRNIELV